MAFPSTFKDLQDAVIASVRLDSTADLAKTKDWLNQVYFTVCVENEVIVTTGNLTLTVGTATYDLASVATNGIARIKAVTVTSGGVVYAPLSQVSLEWILKQRQSSGGVATNRSASQYYALTGRANLDLYPTPGAADTLTFTYVAYPTALSADGDIPVLQEPWSTYLLEAGASAEAADFKSDPGRFEYQQAFAEWQARYRQHLNLRRGQPGAFEFFHEGTFPPHDPATILPMV